MKKNTRRFFLFLSLFLNSCSSNEVVEIFVTDDDRVLHQILDEADKDTPVVTARHTMNIKDYIETDYQPTMARKAFGCWFTTPKPSLYSDTGTQGYYLFSSATFTPRKGLFDKTPPQ